jgi:hypothetical protein
MPGELRMNAYYYAFDETGERAIDRVLSAVACAGKAEHHTTYWSDEHEPYEGHVGTTCVDWIQNAAVDAAAEIASLRKRLADAELELKQRTTFAPG